VKGCIIVEISRNIDGAEIAYEEEEMSGEEQYEVSQRKSIRNL
jgi:hypothetical protein